jgi:hypothetical protein
MRMFLLAPILLLACFFTSCENVQTKINKQIARSAFATHDSIKINRFDLADKYSEQLIKLVSPLKDSEKIKITSFHINTTINNKVGIGKDFVVLPANVNKDNVLIIDSPEYKELLTHNKDLQKQIDNEKNKLDSFAKKTNDILIEKQKELDKEKVKGNIFTKFFNIVKWGTGLGLIGTILVIGGISIFAPELRPVVWNVLNIVFGIFKKIIDLILKEFNLILELIKNHINK